METTFPRLLLQHAAHRPGAAAMREKEYGIWQALSWADLARMVDHLACGLHQAGLRRGEHMVVVGTNRPRLYATMLAAQALGAIPIPLYQDAASAECVFPINNAEVRFAMAEDQEQVDKLLEIRPQCPQLSTIFYDDPRGLRNYAEVGLSSMDALEAAGEAFGREHPGFLQSQVDAGSPDDVAAMFFTSGTTGQPKGVVHTHRTLLDRAQAGAEFDKLTEKEEVLAYMPPAWVGQNIFSYAQWLACGYVVNCPESAATVMIDLKEIGPTYYFAPPRIFEGLLTSVMIRMEDASAIKRRMFHAFMDVARRVGTAMRAGERVGAIDRLKYAIGNVLVYGPLRPTSSPSTAPSASTSSSSTAPRRRRCSSACSRTTRCTPTRWAFPAATCRSR
ncbi:MAG: long-chain-fatty-acid--CoA ligase-like protein [Ramlibacter sp.]|nr:long-chain-fatty-acid--CoA ligase-like protein [Ramlibacter sp.]